MKLKLVLFGVIALVLLSSVAFADIVIGKVLYVNPGVPYNKDMLALQTFVKPSQTYILSGMTNGLDNQINRIIEASGNSFVGPQGILFFNVVKYKVLK
jgi:hypothetical protein